MRRSSSLSRIPDPGRVGRDDEDLVSPKLDRPRRRDHGRGCSFPFHRRRLDRWTRLRRRSGGLWRLILLDRTPPARHPPLLTRPEVTQSMSERSALHRTMLDLTFTALVVHRAP